MQECLFLLNRPSYFVLHFGNLAPNMRFSHASHTSPIKKEKVKHDTNRSTPPNDSRSKSIPSPPLLEPIQDVKSNRPSLQRRGTTARTRYIDMLLGLDQISPFHNLLASLFVWVLLAGYIVFPATFNSLQKSSLDEKADTALKAQALARARNIPLLYVAAVACGIGVVGCLWLWWKHRSNYVWVINRIFLPSLLNSVAGLVSTLVNVYSAHDGK